MGEIIPLLAVALVLAFVGLTSWFWQDENDDLLGLLPLYIAALLFCVDMIFLRRRLHAKSRDFY